MRGAIMHKWGIALLRPVLRQPQTLKDPGHDSEEQVTGREMKEKEKQKDVGMMKAELET